MATADLATSSPPRCPTDTHTLVPRKGVQKNNPGGLVGARKGDCRNLRPCLGNLHLLCCKRASLSLFFRLDTTINLFCGARCLTNWGRKEQESEREERRRRARRRVASSKVSLPVRTPSERAQSTSPGSSQTPYAISLLSGSNRDNPPRLGHHRSRQSRPDRRVQPFLPVAVQGTDKAPSAIGCSSAVGRALKSLSSLLALSALSAHLGDPPQIL